MLPTHTTEFDDFISLFKNHIVKVRTFTDKNRDMWQDQTHLFYEDIHFDPPVKGVFGD